MLRALAIGMAAFFATTLVAGATGNPPPPNCPPASCGCGHHHHHHGHDFGFDDAIRWLTEAPTDDR